MMVIHSLSDKNKNIFVKYEFEDNYLYKGIIAQEYYIIVLMHFWSLGINHLKMYI